MGPRIEKLNGQDGDGGKGVVTVGDGQTNKTADAGEGQQATTRTKAKAPSTKRPRHYFALAVGGETIYLRVMKSDEITDEVINDPTLSRIELP